MTKVYIIKLKSKYEKKEISSLAYQKFKEISLNDFNIDIDKYEIIRNEYNKPYINPNIIYFNISHSYNLIVICISNKECGIDVEKIRKDKKHLLLSNKILDNDELTEYNKTMDKYDYLFKTWTKKESYFKCEGTGIRYSNLKNTFDFRNTLSFKYIYDTINGEEEYYISVTINNQAEKKYQREEQIEFDEIEI